MRKIEINKNEVEDVVREIAAAMEADVQENLIEYTIEIPEDWGSGQITGYRGNSEFSLYVIEGHFTQPVRLDFINRDTYPLSFSYCLSGEYITGLQYKDEARNIEQYQCVAKVNGKKEGYFLQFEPEIHLRLWNIECDKSRLKEELEVRNHPVPDYFANLFEEIDKNNSFIINHMYSIRMSDLFNQLDDLREEGFLKVFLIRALMWQIVGNHLSLYEEELNNDGVHHSLRQYEIDCVHQAGRRIEENLEELGTIVELSRQVGLNSNKLQDGFKLLYRKTINEFVQDVRMQKACTMLQYSEYNISEIANKVGLNSISYFSKIFKETYGFTPSDYRKNRRKTVGEN